jgi:hypothetical protein
VFVTVSHIYPCLTFERKAGAYPSGTPYKNRGMLSLAGKDKAGFEVADSGKHSSLLRHGINLGRKKFYMAEKCLK